MSQNRIQHNQGVVQYGIVLLLGCNVLFLFLEND